MVTVPVAQLQQSIGRWGLVCLTMLFLGACTSRSFTPPTYSESSEYISRGKQQTDNGITVLAAVPGRDETRQLLGIDLYAQGVQPVWLEVTNRTEQIARIALVSLDDEYYSPLEVAWRNRKAFSKQGRADLERWLYEWQMHRRIPPGETRAGLVFTRVEKGTKGFNVDVHTLEGSAHFTFLIPVPGFRADYADIVFKELYRDDELVRLETAEELRSRLRDRKCCSTDEAGTGDGEAFNIAFVAKALALRRALLRGDWQETRADSPETALARAHHYRGRPPDAVFHKTRPDGSERKELRIWMTPVRLGTSPVWFAQANYEMSGIEIFKTFLDPQIDPDIDDARMFVVQNFWYSQSLGKLGFVSGASPSTLDEPAQNFYDAPYFTDGLMAVLFVPEDPVALDEGEILPWEVPQ